MEAGMMSMLPFARIAISLGVTAIHVGATPMCDRSAATGPSRTWRRSAAGPPLRGVRHGRSGATSDDR